MSVNGKRSATGELGERVERATAPIGPSNTFALNRVLSVVLSSARHSMQILPLCDKPHRSSR